MLPLTRPAADACARPELDPGDVLSRWFAAAAEGDLRPWMLRLSDGEMVALEVARWAGPVTEADETMLRRTHGPVLDVGCGPGRLTAALHARGVDVLGVELLPEVPVLARQAGAPLHVGDVFGPLPDTAGWRTVLLADGNVGIGGDVARMLRRVRALLEPGGRCCASCTRTATTRRPARCGWRTWARQARGSPGRCSDLPACRPPPTPRALPSTSSGSRTGAASRR
ncbi:MAG: class I SAM-dependent methyltransferase [Actinomycetota bacterium]|nr:class I SAM-dependent methyltransferase [Actinomycetota bacterium]